MASARPDAADRAAPLALPRDGLILLALVTLAWGLAWPAMKIVLNEMSPWTFRALTLPAGGLILMGLSRLLGQPLAVPPGKWPALIVVSLVNVGGWHLFSALGLAHLPSGRAVLIAYTMPLWTSLAGTWLLGERLTRRLGIALVLGMGRRRRADVGGHGGVGRRPPRHCLHADCRRVLGNRCRAAQAHHLGNADPGFGRLAVGDRLGSPDPDGRSGRRLDTAVAFAGWRWEPSPLSFSGLFPFAVGPSSRWSACFQPTYRRSAP